MKTNRIISILAVLTVSHVFGLDVIYNNEPIALSLSSDMPNQINMPTGIKKAYTKNGGIEAKIRGDVVTIAVEAGTTDLEIETDNKTYMFVVKGSQIPPVVVDVKDNSIENNTNATVDGTHKSDSYIERMAHLIVAAQTGKILNESSKQPFIKTVSTPEWIFSFEEKYKAAKDDLVIAKVINKTTKQMQIREDFRIVKDTVEAATGANGRMYALTKQFVNPGEAITLYAVVSKNSRLTQQVYIPKKSKEDQMLDEYINMHGGQQQ